MNIKGFIEGSDGKVPDILAKIGIQVLKAWPLRIYAGYLSYFNKALSTLDACRIGRLHCVTDQWVDSSVAFLQSGGFRVTKLIPNLRQKKTLVLWGRDDGILDVKTAEQFREAPPTSEIVIFDECGHVPHLEKPIETAEAIFNFLSK